MRAGGPKGLRCSHRFENWAERQGYRRVAGVDEVGRGALFGPVVAAAVILDPQRPIPGLNDSKQLDAGRREELAARIRETALAVGLGAVDAARIDRINIYQASRLAMREAVESLAPAAPDFLLVDAMHIDLPLPQRALIHGDCLSVSIAAASIVAKVERDAWMRVWDAVFPCYRLADHKGYATSAHREALVRYGPSPLHRFSFAPVAGACRNGLNRRAENLDLFNDQPQ